MLARTRTCPLTKMQAAVIRLLAENRCGELGVVAMIDCAGMVDEWRSCGHDDLDQGEMQVGNHSQHYNSLILLEFDATTKTRLSAIRTSF